jgi:hypothetical protein
MEKLCLAVVVASLAVASSRASADDGAQLVRALQFSREFFAKTHLVAEVILQQREGNTPATHFSYDRYPDVERIKTELGQVFARRKGSTWLKSDDWAKTGSPVAANEVTDIESRIYIANVAWNTSRTSYDKTQGADVTKLVKHTNDKDGEHLVFERTRENPTSVTYPRYTFTKYPNIANGEPLLGEFSGPVVLGNQKLFLTVRYTALIELKNARVKVMKSPARNGQ